MEKKAVTQVQRSMGYDSEVHEEYCTVMKYLGVFHYTYLLPLTGASNISNNMKNTNPLRTKFNLQREL
jgi:hypothetical protein